MSEVGIDISSHTSNNFEEYNEIDFQHIITVCDHAASNCPIIKSNASVHHYSFPDPSTATGSNEEVIEKFRKVRDQIKECLETFVKHQLL